MVADDADAADIGILRQGAGGGTNQLSLTPNLDGIARRGAVFTAAHAAAPLCSPSRFAILTGLRPQCTHTTTALRAAAAAAAGMTSRTPPLVSFDAAPRPSRHPTLAHRLSSLGYTTGIVGLWHLGMPHPVSKAATRRHIEEATAEKFAQAMGGRVKRAVLAEYAALQKHVKRVGGFDEADRLYGAPLDADDLVLPKGMSVHNVEWVADGAAQFIQDKGAPDGKPFFLYIGWTLPHGPDADRSLKDAHMAHTPAGTWKMPKALISVNERARQEVRARAATAAEVFAARAARGDKTAINYAAGFQGHNDYGAALAWLDRGVGTVLWALQRRGIVHNTLLTFTSDHGPIDKGHCFSRATLTPLLMQWPDVLRPGAWVHEPTSLLDVAATMLHAALDPANASLFATPGRVAPPSAGLPSAPPLHGISLLTVAPTHLPGPPKYLQFRSPPPPPPDYVGSRKIVCEMGHTRSLLTRSFRYVFAPVPVTKRGGAEATQRHPGMLAVEQLYDLNDDPDEAKELIQAYRLLATPLSESEPLTRAAEVRAADAFGNFRRAMQKDLIDVAATCGV